MKGRVVHAVKGERERYQPVESILTASADPVEITRCLQSHGFIGLERVPGTLRTV